METRNRRRARWFLRLAALLCIGAGLACAADSASVPAPTGPPEPVVPVGPPAPAIGATTAAPDGSAPAPAPTPATAPITATGSVTLTVWVVRCPSARFDPARGEPDHLDRSDFDHLVADGVLVIDDQVTATGAANAHLHGERRHDLPKNSLFTASCDHVGLDLDGRVDTGDADHPALDVSLVRHALVQLGAAGTLPTMQTTTWSEHVDFLPGALRFIGHGTRPGGDQAESVLAGVGGLP